MGNSPKSFNNNQIKRYCLDEKNKIPTFVRMRRVSPPKTARYNNEQLKRFREIEIRRHNSQDFTTLLPIVRFAEKFYDRRRSTIMQ